jgi:hypothetical protein
VALSGVNLRGNEVLLHKVHQCNIGLVKHGKATKLRQIRRESIGSLERGGALCASWARRCLAADIQTVANQNVNVVVAEIRPIRATVDTSFNIRLRGDVVFTVPALRAARAEVRNFAW